MCLKMNIQQLARFRYLSTAFIQINTRTIMDENPNFTYREAFAISSSNWRNLSDDDKQVFSDSLRDLRNRLNVPQPSIGNNQ